ncbi:MAG: hypothetical protein Q8Q20_00045 [bacterium]|nr:hypothetical protein [bacterium]
MKNFIQEAKKLIDQYHSSEHRVGAVLRSKDGTLFKGVSVQGQKLNLCSEWAAMTQALMAGAEIDLAVAVFKSVEGEYKIFAPCGICRELYISYFPNAKVIISDTEAVEAVSLLPHAWIKKSGT